ncbi:MAG: hypothetical protein H8E05_00980 [Bacteroidetes bacterium]|nr:hypothetical protein [Bacteroidota bacterium]
MKRTVIGLSGVAGAGKDLFFSLLSGKLNVRRFALADALKREASTWTQKQYGIDALKCSRKEKEMIRPFLVQHGTQKRKMSKGRYWIDSIDKNIKGFLLNAETKDIPVVTDIRYQEYERDEVVWLTEELDGMLVHISQFEVERATGKRTYHKPANSEEEKMDPILEELADYRVKWPRVEDKEVRHEILNQHVDKFISFYEKCTRNSN